MRRRTTKLQLQESKTKSIPAKKKATATKKRIIAKKKVKRVATAARSTTATKTKTTTSRPKKRRAVKGEEGVIYFWRNETDPFTIHSDSSSSSGMVMVGNETFEYDTDNDTDDDNDIDIDSSRKIEFTIRGNPLPLARHRSKGKFMYNPSAKKQEQFRNVMLHSLLPNSCFNNTSTSTRTNAVPRDTNTVIPFFDQEESIAVKILFRLKRPKNHFRSSIPGPGRLRPVHATNLQNTRQDVDNLAKFVLDALNGVLYDDDRQIVSLNVLKVMDYEGHCEGATKISMEVIRDSDVEHWLEEEW